MSYAGVSYQEKRLKALLNSDLYIIGEYYEHLLAFSLFRGSKIVLRFTLRPRA